MATVIKIKIIHPSNGQTKTIAFDNSMTAQMIIDQELHAPSTYLWTLYNDFQPLNYEFSGSEQVRLGSCPF